MSSCSRTQGQVGPWVQASGIRRNDETIDADNVRCLCRIHNVPGIAAGMSLCVLFLHLSHPCQPL